MMAGKSTKGICYFCGKSITKAGAKKHLITHECTVGDKQACMLVKVESPYLKEYWLYADIPLTSPLESLDTFLRDIWLECCGHMSAFYFGRYDRISFSSKISSFSEGDTLSYEYDFGSTTNLKITFMGTYFRKKQRANANLLARNDAPEYKCALCGKTAQIVCVDCIYETDNCFYCEECIEKHMDESDHEFTLPVVNSPRMGVCGYEGDGGKYDFKKILY